VTWSRRACAEALAFVLEAAATPPVLFETEALVPSQITVFEQPPSSINPPALVIARPIEVRYGTAALSIDDAELPIVCCGPVTDDDTLDDLIAFVRQTLAQDPTLGAVVQSCTPELERSWRPARVAGVDLLVVDLVLRIQM
jgi:hypothetical protein